MCGFLYVTGPQSWSSEQISIFRRSSERLGHRGNSDYGEFILGSTAIFHYRLAFRDLEKAKQPMHDYKNEQVIAYNGELYGIEDSKQHHLASYPFQTGSDTEVILASYEKYKDELISQFDGEFAFVIHNKKDDHFIAGRDFFGIKPLFLYSDSIRQLAPGFFRNYQECYEFELTGPLALTSELKAIPFDLSWETEGLMRQFTGLYEEIKTPFENVIQIPPGSVLKGHRKGGKILCRIERKISRHTPEVSQGPLSFEKKVRKLREIVSRKVKSRLASDVPLGAYLSGGVDSTIIVYEMLRAEYDFTTFTVGFEGEDYDETDQVRAFCKKFPALKNITLNTTNTALEYAYPLAIYTSELVQPYTNGAAKWWLSNLASHHVRGVLTGDGADELFCGYPSYRYLYWFDKMSAPDAYREQVASSSHKPWEKGLSNKDDGSDLEASLDHWGWPHPLFNQVQNLSDLWHGDPVTSRAWIKSLKKSLGSYLEPVKQLDPTLQWHRYFLHTHLPTHILNWVGDRMEMANTIEGRPPLLSKQMLDFVLSLETDSFINNLEDKYIFRQAYKKDLEEFFKKPKKQFNAPFLFTPALREKYLNPGVLRDCGFISAAKIERIEKQIKDSGDPLFQSYGRMFLQNILALHMQHLFLVKKENPVRDHLFEEEFIHNSCRYINF